MKDAYKQFDSGYLNEKHSVNKCLHSPSTYNPVLCHMLLVMMNLLEEIKEMSKKLDPLPDEIGDEHEGS